MSQQQNQPTPPSSQPGGPPGRPDLWDIQGFVRKFIPFSQRPIVNGLKSGPGQYIIATFTTAHTDQTFTHSLGHIPSEFIVCSAPLPAAPVTVPTVPVSVLQGGTGVTTLAASPFVVLTPGGQQTGSINVSSTGTFGGAVTASSFVAGSSTYAATSAVIAGNVNANIALGQYQINGNPVLYSDTVSSNIRPAASGGSCIFNSFNGANNNFIMTDGGLATFRGTVLAANAVGGGTAYVPPVYTAAGGALASTTHAVEGQVTAGGLSTTVTLTGAAVFASTAYFVQILDLTTLALATITATASNSFTFNSVNGQVYNYFAIGA